MYPITSANRKSFFSLGIFFSIFQIKKLRFQKLVTFDKASYFRHNK